MGMVGILLVIEAASRGPTPAGMAAGLGGAALVALGFRFGSCPACTVARLVAARGTP